MSEKTERYEAYIDRLADRVERRMKTTRSIAEAVHQVCGQCPAIDAANVACEVESRIQNRRETAAQ